MISRVIATGEMKEDPHRIIDCWVGKLRFISLWAVAKASVFSRFIFHQLGIFR